MIIIVGIFNVIDGLRALTSSNQVEDALGGTELPLTNDVKTWGWVVLIIGAVMILAGLPDLLREHVRADRRCAGRGRRT